MKINRGKRGYYLAFFLCLAMSESIVSDSNFLSFFLGYSNKIIKDKVRIGPNLMVIIS